MAGAKRASIDEIRGFFAELLATASRSSDPRLRRAFELVPREAFVGPGPWQIYVDRRYIRTPSADPFYVYQSGLVALDAEKGINNGEPFLHAGWIAAVAPQPGETVCHIGAGTGYYSAILSLLVLPGGAVHAFEIEPGLAARARSNLRSFDNVTLVEADATAVPLPQADVIYMNAGVAEPPRAWLEALRVGARMTFPWRPAEDVGLTLLVTRTASGYAVKPIMASWFIPCVGASSRDAFAKLPSEREARSVRSLRLAGDSAPDETAVAAGKEVWFSSAEP